MTRIRQWLWVGSWSDACDADALHEAGIGSMLGLTHHRRPAHQAGRARAVHVGFPDTGEADPRL